VRLSNQQALNPYDLPRRVVLVARQFLSGDCQTCIGVISSDIFIYMFGLLY